MRIVSVIVTDRNEGTINSVDSFGIFEEQLSDDVVRQAEDHFIEKCVELKYGVQLGDETREDLQERNSYREEVSESLEDGYEIMVSSIVSIVWSDI